MNNVSINHKQPTVKVADVAVLAFARRFYPDADETFSQCRAYYQEQYSRWLLNARHDACDLSNVRAAGVA